MVVFTGWGVLVQYHSFHGLLLNDGKMESMSVWIMFPSWLVAYHMQAICFDQVFRHVEIHTGKESDGSRFVITSNTDILVPYVFPCLIVSASNLTNQG